MLTSVKKKTSLKIKTIATISAIICAVALPQVFHIVGRISGVSNTLGTAFLPMHLPIILVGLLSGGYVGAVAGALSPIVSFYLTGMPSASMLPFMIIELCAYGAFAGALKNVKIPVVIKVLCVQILGRSVRAAAILVSVYAFGNSEINPFIILSSISAGACGIALQLVLIPHIVHRINRISNYEL